MEPRDLLRACPRTLPPWQGAGFWDRLYLLRQGYHRQAGPAWAGGATAPASGDYNNDGVQNGIAYFMGENDLASNPGIVDGKVIWKHVGVVASFEVQVSDNLATWVPAAPETVDTTSNPGYVIDTLPTGESKKFCRLIVTP